MQQQVASLGYNQRLFSRGVRGRLHNMRFDWLRRKMPVDGAPYTVFELGCFDCRTLDYLPQPISRYVGADAGWESGLEAARQRFNDDRCVELHQARSAEDLVCLEGRTFDYTLALETLEHIPPVLLPGYLALLAEITGRFLLVSVPVEVGPVFLGKFLAKKSVSSWRGAKTDSYSLNDVFWSTVGQVERVKRDEHKGFDYRLLIEQIAAEFEIINVEGLPLKPLPLLSFQVGIVARPRR